MEKECSGDDNKCNCKKNYLGEGMYRSGEGVKKTF